MLIKLKGPLACWRLYQDILTRTNVLSVINLSRSILFISRYVRCHPHVTFQLDTYAKNISFI